MNNREFVIEFISKLKELPCLWQTTNRDYHNKHKREAALAELLNLYRNQLPGATLETVKKRIQALRASFRKEHNKVKSSRLSGAGTDEVHVPKLWFYDQLLFLSDTETARGTTTISSIISDPFEDIEETNNLTEESLDSSSVYFNSLSPQPSTQPSTSPYGKKRQTKIETNSILSKIAKRTFLKNLQHSLKNIQPLESMLLKS